MPGHSPRQPVLSCKAVFTPPLFLLVLDDGIKLRQAGSAGSIAASISSVRASASRSLRNEALDSRFSQTPRAFRLPSALTSSAAHL
jgi:hypothetical protein